MAKVSVVIPTYNVEPYLRECMDSLIGQTLEDIEIICVNDGSTDNSLQILKEYAARDKRVVIIDKENGGYGMAMNMGIARATGEYIGIVEPDDFVPEYMYKELYEIASSNNLDFVKADFYRFKGNSATGQLQLEYNQLDSTKKHYNRVLKPYEEPCVIQFIMNTWSGIYKRAFLEEHDIRHNETPGASFQDNGFFWQTFMYAERVMFLNKPYYMNRRDNPNSSVKNKEKVYCMNTEYYYIRQIFREKGNEELWDKFKYYYNLKRYHNYVFTLSRISGEFKKEYVNRISEEFREAAKLGEIDFGLFSLRGKVELKMLIKSPSAYYRWVVNKGRKG